MAVAALSICEDWEVKEEFEGRERRGNASSF
jgi:hypothetical protein